MSSPCRISGARLLELRKYVSKQPGTHRILVGRDPRFMGEMFVAEAARLLAEGGVVPEVIAEAAPTPAIAYAVRQRKTSGAINFTASHNPPEYNGIKFSTPDGAPALPEVTRQIEAEIAGLGDAEIPQGTTNEKFVNVDVKPDYLKRLAELIDIPAIAKAKLRIVVDPFWGAGRGYAQQLLAENGVSAVSVHDYRDVLFGGHAPEPDDALLGDCRAKMRETGAHLGIASDGDADRFGIVDQDGTFIQPNYIIALLFDYLVETRGWRNGVAKSVATTNCINALAEHYKIRAVRNAGGIQVHWRADRPGQDCDWRGRERGPDHSRACSREGRHSGGAAGGGDGGGARQDDWRAIADPFWQGGFLLSSSREFSLDARGQRQLH